MIDIKPIRNYMRSKLLSAVIIPAADYAWEGRNFDPGTRAAYIAEVIQPDNDDKAATDIYGAQVTFTYNIYTLAGDTEGQNRTSESYSLLMSVAAVFMADRPTQITGGYWVTIQGIKRRIATEENGWRLSPIDITVRIEKPV